MFSWSIKWVWAQCLLVGAGLFLLAHMAVPNSSDLTTVRGTVQEFGSISRKGLGSFYELKILTEDAKMERVLVALRDITSSSMQNLVGRKIVTRVNWSSEAIDLISSSDGNVVLSSASSTATSRSHDLSMAGWIATVLGLLAGAATLSANTIARRLPVRDRTRRR